MNIYEKNLEFFRNNLTSIYDCLLFEESKYNSIIEVFSNPINICVQNEEKKCFVHSTYDIERQSNNMFYSIDKNIDKLVIFGFGVGGFNNYICSNFSNLRNITIIEPDLNIFKVMLQYVDFVELINKIGNITCIINKTKEETTEILWDCLKDTLTEKVELVYNLTYRSLYPEYFEYIDKTITSNVKNYLINMATEDLFLFKWAENIINNNKHSALLLAKLAGEFKDIPVILVSAGPSLNYNMQYLKQVKDKCVIIALGSAIKILDNNGIVPHFRLAFDGSEAERNVFRNIDTGASALIFSDMLNYHIINEYKGNKLRMVLDTDHISQYIQSKVYDSNFIFQSGFSVANVALDVALRLGFKKIIFIGQDLCYTEGNVHAKGTWREDDNKVNFDESKYLKTTNVLGETVYSDKAFLGMKDYLEQKIKLNNGIAYINATERGLNIEGTVNKTFPEVIKDDLNNDFNIGHTLTLLFSQNNDDKTKELEVLNSILIKELNKVIIINEDRLKKLKKLNRYFKKGLGINKLQLELEYIQAIEKELESIDLYKRALKPMIFNKFKTIYMNYAYNGKDKKILMEKNIKALLGQTVSLKEYLSFIFTVCNKVIDD